MNPRSRQLLTVALIGLLAVFAAWGWMRKPATNGNVGATNFAAAPAGAPATGYSPSNQYGDPNQYAQPTNLNAPPPGYGADRYAQPVSSNGTYSYAGNGGAGPCVSDAMYAPDSAEPYYARRGYVRTVRPRNVVYDNGSSDRVVTHYTEREPVHYYKERSKKKSALIVAGGAGAGAAIGALAGGGKGAGIGALAGGAGGFIYDRLTHRQRLR